jgi:hypothetical protein
MIVNTAVFTCSICGEPSTEICAYCTKDACANHRCIRCNRCSDCCECEIPLSAEEVSEEPEAPEQATLAPEHAVAPAVESPGSAESSREDPQSPEEQDLAEAQDVAEAFPNEEDRHEL